MLKVSHVMSTLSSLNTYLDLKVQAKLLQCNHFWMKMNEYAMGKYYHIVLFNAARFPPVSLSNIRIHFLQQSMVWNIVRIILQLGLTQLTPDITIFSNNLRKVIHIELTCPCDENMESWHSTNQQVLSLKNNNRI